MECKCVCVRACIVSDQCWTTLMQPSKKKTIFEALDCPETMPEYISQNYSVSCILPASE
jgi:hypothetical protein